jgi:hypothetical protein
MRKPFDIKEIEQYYTVFEDGSVLSKIKGRYLKPQQNSCGYIYYFLQFPYKRWFFAHQLVAAKYIGKADNLDINHIDHNKANNHHSNLEYISHSLNILKSYNDNNRTSYWKEHHKPPHSIETKIKMSNARLKPVNIYRFDKFEYLAASIDNAANYLNVNRNTIYRAIKNGGNYKTYILSFHTE